MTPPFANDSAETGIATTGMRLRREWLREKLLSGAKYSSLALVLAVVGALCEPFLGRESPIYLASVFAMLVSLGLVPLFSVLAAGLKLLPRHGGTLRIDGDKVLRFPSWGGVEQALAPSEIREGIVVPERNGTRAELHLRSGNVFEAIFSSPEQAEHLLTQLGLGPERRRASAHTGTAMRRLAGGCGFWFFGFAGFMVLLPKLVNEHSPQYGGFIVLAMALAGVLAWVLGGMFSGSQVTVGTDGVYIVQGPWKRFVPYEELERVSVIQQGLQLQIRGTQAYTVLGDRAVCQGLANRIEKARAVGAGNEDTQAWVESLDRAGKSLAEWRKSLELLLRGDGGYRSFVPTREALLRVLEDVDAAVERRIAAAIMLEKIGNEETKERVRVVAESTASEPVRVVLEQIAQGANDEVLEEAVQAATKVRVVSA